MASLTVTEPLSNATITIPISDQNSIPAAAFGQLKIPQTCPKPEQPDDKVPVRLFDPGFKNTAVCKSAISHIDGDKGKLFYRGYDVEELVEQSTFLEVAFLLIYGTLPSQSQYDAWVYKVMHHTYVHTEIEEQMLTFRFDAHPMGMLIATIASLSTFHPEANPALQGPNLYMKPKNASNDEINAADAARDKAIYRMLGKVPTIAANAYRHRQGRAYNPPMSHTSSYCENLLYMMDKLNEQDYRPDARLVRVLEKAFILLAEHGTNCSTVMMRHLGSSGVDPYTALSGASGALFGERKRSMNPINTKPIYIGVFF